MAGSKGKGKAKPPTPGGGSKDATLITGKVGKKVRGVLVCLHAQSPVLMLRANRGVHHAV
jgi:hypothetical protein